MAFSLNKVRYYDDRKLPFELIKEMPRILEKALRNINQTKLSRVSKSVKNEENEGGELHNFVRYNESGLNNLLVYLFWIVVSFSSSYTLQHSRK